MHLGHWFFMMLGLIFLLLPFCSSIQVQTALGYQWRPNLLFKIQQQNILEKYLRVNWDLNSKVEEVGDVSLTYTNPVLPHNSPDPGALALPDGSGEIGRIKLVPFFPNSVLQVMHWLQRPILHIRQKETLPYPCIFPQTWYVWHTNVCKCVLKVRSLRRKIYFQVNWIPKGHVFPAGSWPDWAVENMWAPEIHFVNGTFLVYFTGGSGVQ